MTYSINPSRRRFFAQTGAGLLAYAGLPGWLHAMEGMGEMPKMAPKKASANFHPDVELDLVCKPSTVSILPGQATRVQQYFAKLVKGPDHTLTEIPGSYLGPIMRFEKGQKIRINLRSELDEPTITHWHGLHVPADVDVFASLLSHTAMRQMVHVSGILVIAMGVMMAQRGMMMLKGGQMPATPHQSMQQPH